MKEKNNKGFALVFALVLLVTLPILAMAVANLSLNSFKMAHMNDKKTKAYYLARSGAEAVISAWKKEPLDSKPDGEVKEVVFTDKNNFILKSNYSSDNGKKEAEIGVEIVDNNDGSVSFISTADLGNYSDTVTATMSIYNRGDNLDPAWYNSDGIIQPGPETETATVPSSFLDWLSGIFGGDYSPQTVDIKYHEPVYGTIELDSSDDTLSLADDEDRNKVALIANSLFFRDSLDLRQSWGRKGALITSAETLVFDKIIKMNKENYLVVNNYGTLVLGVPDKQGFKLEGHDGVYGRAYFKKNVILSGRLGNSDTIIEAGSAYYFKKITETDDSGKEVESGLDLIRWSDEDYTDDVMIKIQDDDKNAAAPVVEEKYIVIWN